MWAGPYLHLFEPYQKEWMDDVSTQGRLDICNKIKQDILDYRREKGLKGVIPRGDSLINVSFIIFVSVMHNFNI